MKPHKLEKIDKKLRETFNSPSRVRGLMRGLALGLVGLAVGLVLVACSSGPSSSAAPSPPAPSPGPGGGETTYEVRFDAKGGTPIPPMQMVTNGVNGNLAVEPKPAPSKDERSELLGWVDENIFKTNAGSTQYFTFANTPISNDLTLVAQWGVKTYLVSFIDGGDLAAETSNQRIKHGSNVIRPAKSPKKAGHTFQNWYADSEFKDTFDFNTKITAATKIYAQWSKLTYTVTFAPQGGTPTPTGLNVPYGSSITKPATDPKRTGHTFTGWYRDTALKNEFTFATDTITAATTLYAGWRKNSYMVSFNLNGGTGVEQTNIKHGEKVTAPTNPERSGHVFDGWYADSEFKTPFNFNITITSATNVYAKWLIAYRVSFITNSKTPSAPAFAEQTVGSGRKATNLVEIPERTGQFFAGWFADKATNVKFELSEVSITSNTIVYAGWADKGVIVTFNTGGGSAVAEQRITYGTKATKPSDPTRSGYSFLGWYATAGAITTATPTFNFDTALTGNTNIYAKWIKTHVVTFVTNVGNPNFAVQTVRQGSNAIAPSPAPKRFGYDFGGWYKDAALTTAFNFNAETITAATTLYAKWTLSRHVVTFEMNGATPTLPVQNIDHGKVATEPRTPTLTGHTFKGWYVSSDFSGSAFNFANPITADTTLYAKWERNRYTVTFKLNGGSGNAREEVLYTNTVASPAPKRQGHTFEGWYTDSGFTQVFNLSTKITANLTLYAKWERITYKVSFEMNGATPSIAQQNIKYSNTANKPTDPTLTGHTFGGWFTNAGFSGSAFDFRQGISNTTIFYAKWTRNSYTVTFNSGGGSGVTAQNVLYTNKAEKPADPTLAGHTFENWYVNSDFSGSAFDFSTSITANRTLYAKWTRNTYKVTFNSGGGSGVAAQDVLYTNKATQPAAPTLRGFTFKGWFTTAATNTGFNFNSDITGPTTIYASWERNIYKVTFDSRAGSAVAAQQVLYTNKATRPGNPTREGHTFDKWYVDAGLSTEFDFNAEVTNTLTAYAKWNTRGYSVTFITNIPNVGAPPLKTITVQFTNKVAKLANPSRTGATFAGWFWERGLTTAFNFDRDVIKSNTTLYAKWATDTYQVTFNSGGGSAVNPQTIAHNDRVPKPSNPTRSGYAFLNWYTNGGYAGRVFNFGTERITAATTLYARWIKTYAVTFVTNVGNPNFAVQTVRQGSNAVAPSPAPTRTGHTFGGWYKEAALTTVFNFGTERITAPITLYAKWEVIYHQVTFNANGGKVANSGLSTTNVRYAEGRRISEGAPTRDGHTFAGWYTDSATTALFNTNTRVVTAPITLYAKWNINSYTVTYYLADDQSRPVDPGTLFSNQRGVVYDTLIEKPVPDPTVAPLNNGRGLRFRHWSPKIGQFGGIGTFDFTSDTIKGDTTLYASWLYTRKVTFATNAAGAEWTNRYVAQSSSLETEGIKSTTLTPTREGHTFAGWFTSAATNSLYNFANSILDPITLYAGWVPKRYAVTFITNVGDPAFATQRIPYTNKATALTPPARTGYTFRGWFTNRDYTGSQFGFASERITAAITLYAKWTRNAYTVTFQANGGSAVAAQNVLYTNTATQPTNPTLTGYTFDGWYKEAALTTVFNFDKDVITAPITIYAKWKINSYTVAFEENGGSAVSDQSVNYLGTASSPATSVRPGYIFEGWFKDSGTTQAFNFATERITGNITIYARWVQVHTVTFNSRGGTAVAPIAGVTNGRPISRPSAPSRENKVFLGWFTDSGATQAFDFSTAITADRTLYAGWRDTSGPSFEVTGVETDRNSDPRFSSVKGIAVYNNDAYVMAGRLNNRLFRVSNNGDRVIVNNGVGYPRPDHKFYTGSLDVYGGYAYLALEEDVRRGQLPSGTKIVKVSLTDGTASDVSTDTSIGTDLRVVKGIAVSNSTKAYVLDGNEVNIANRVWKVVEVNLSTGERTLVSAVGSGAASPRGTGEGILSPRGIALYGNKAYVVDTSRGFSSSLGALIEVDLTSGNRTLISQSGTRGTGTGFESPSGVAFHNGAAYVVDGSSVVAAVIKVDLSTGNRTVISSRTVGTANYDDLSDFTPESIAIHNGVAYVTDNYSIRVLKVDLSTGARTLLSK